MKDIEEVYEFFGSILENREKMPAFSSFDEVCGFLGADRMMLEEHIFSEVGLTGNEVLEIYRKTSCIAGNGD